MHFDLDKNERNISDLIKLLNIPAIEFYSDVHTFSDPTYPMFLKATLLQMIKLIEGAISGTFNCDLSSTDVKVDALRKMFPIGCDVLGVKEQKDIYLFGKIMCGLRNINAHAVISNEDKDVLIFMPFVLNRLRNLKRFSANIRTVSNNGNISLGGLILLILLFLREQSIKVATVVSKTVSLIATGGLNRPDGSAFVQQISKTNLELPIRTETGETLYHSIVGEYDEKVISKPRLCELFFGFEDDKHYKVSFRINEKSVFIESGSLTKAYYEENYNLDIKYLDGFIEQSNMLPPFVFVDLLYKLKINEYTKKTYKLIQEKMHLYSKLNYPKFYCDKNIDILIMNETIADFRIVSNAISNSLNTIFLRFEKNILNDRLHQIESGKYSKFNETLKLLNISKETINQISLLRNASTHSYLLNEYCFYNNKVYKYTFEDTINTLICLLTELKKHETELFEQLQEDIYAFIVNRLMGIRYKQVIDYTKSVISGHTVEDPDSDTIKNRFLFVESSMYDIASLTKLYVDRKPVPSIKKYIVEGEQYPFYIYNQQIEEDRFKSYLKQLGYKYVKKESSSNGMVETIYLVKQ